MVKGNPVGQAKQFGPPSQGRDSSDRFYCGNLSPSPGKIDRIGPKPAAYFQQPFTAPAAEVGKRGNVRLSHV